MSSHSHRQSLDTWAKGHNQPPFISPLATCCAFDLFLCCNLILSIALESCVFTLCSSHLELTKIRRAPNFTTICPEKQGEERICRQGQARPDSGGSRGGRPPMYQYMYGFTGLSLFLTLSMAFCKDFLLLCNEYLIKQKLKPQISKLTHVPFCTDLQTWVWWIKSRKRSTPPSQCAGFQFQTRKGCQAKRSKIDNDNRVLQINKIWAFHQ